MILTYGTAYNYCFSFLFAFFGSGYRWQDLFFWKKWLKLNLSFIFHECNFHILSSPPHAKFSVWLHSFVTFFIEREWVMASRKSFHFFVEHYNNSSMQLFNFFFFAARSAKCKVHIKWNVIHCMACYPISNTLLVFHFKIFSRLYIMNN